MLNSVIIDCYGTVLCTVIIVVTLLLDHKKYGKKLSLLFLNTIMLALIEAVSGSVERYIANSANYHPMRLVLSWVCYIVAPAILLSVVETIIRNSKMWVKVAVAIPEVINILVTSTAFFAPWCFSMDPVGNHFISGPLIFIPRYSVIVYLVIVAVAAFYNVRRSKWECTTVLLLTLLIAFNYIDERSLHLLGDAREMTIAISILAYFMYFVSVHHIDELTEIGNRYVRSEEKLTKEMLDQAIETLAYTIDAKDRYTKGHSFRVAKYSRMIANIFDKSDAECREIYLAGLLHDIGKISISDDIINKAGRLTDEEFAKIKKHPAKGALILDKMRDIPYLQVGAKYHHERYDGKGYPCGLKGEEIPEMARIIAVADAYDAMTSVRSYRSLMEQVEVKQEIWKGMGTQFDPLYAKAMISLIDADVNYDMREKPGELDEIIFEDLNKTVSWPALPEEHKSAIDTHQDTDFSTLAAFILVEDKWSIDTQETLVTENPVKVAFRSNTKQDAKYLWNTPSVLLYTSENGKLLGPGYEELGVFMSAGYSWKAGSSVYDYSLLTRKNSFLDWNNWLYKNKKGMEYTVQARRENHMVYLTIDNELAYVDGELTLSANNDKPVYFLVFGEYCSLYLLR